MGDAFFQTVRPYQRNNYLFLKHDNNYVFSTGYAQMRPHIDATFLLSFLQTENFVKNVLNNCTGTSYPAINSTDLANLMIVLPLSIEHLRKKLEGLLKKMPLEEYGQVTEGNPGIYRKKSIIDILHIFELEGILYKAGIPDFSVCAKVTVSIENMNEIRRENFRKCDIKCTEIWSQEKYEGKSRWTPSDVKQWRKENGYTWHERNDMVICDLIPTKMSLTGSDGLS